MKKNFRMLLSMLLVLVFVFQFSGSLAWADDADVTVTGKEALVYALSLTNPDPEAQEKLIPVSAEEEAEKLGGKSYSVVLEEKDQDQKKTDPLSRSAGSIVLEDLLKKDLIVTPPEGYSISRIYLRGDAVETQKIKLLPLSADAEKPVLTLKAGSLAAKDKSFDKEFLTTFSTVDPQIYTLELVLAPLETEKPLTVTVAEGKDAAGTDHSVEPGNSFTAPEALPNGAERQFAGWKLVYENGASLKLEPGQSFKPYAKCRLEAQWTEIITLTANAPVEEGDGFVPNGWTWSGKLREGDVIDFVALSVQEQEDGFVSVPSDAVIKNGEENVTDRYILRYVQSEAVKKDEEPAPQPTEEPAPQPTEEPAPPEKVKLTVTAKEPVSNDGGKTYEQAGAFLSAGALNEGDAFTNIAIDVKQNEDGTFIAVPRDAVIKNGDTDNTANYEISYVASQPVTPPAPEKVKLTVTAKEPVSNDGGKTYEQAGAFLSAGALNEGDAFTNIAIDVKQNEDGTYIAVPRDAVIKNGDTDNTANYEISYVASQPVTPPAPEKVKITITAREPVTKDGGKTYEQDNAVLSAGKLNEGDSITALVIDVKQNEDGTFIAVPRDAVIKNGDTDNTANYEITYEASKPVTPPAEKIAITLRSKDRSAEYSGKLITAQEYELTSGALAEGDTLEVKYEGGSTNVTASPVASPIASVVIKDASGADVTESKYAVTIDNENAGKVTVTKHPITVTAISGSVETDGTKVIYAKDCKTANGSFTRGHKVEGLLESHELRGDFVKGYGSETFTTSIDLNELRVVDTANGDTDVTANYDIKTVDGKMTIKVTSKTGVPVALTVKDQSRTYDGAAHKPDQNGYNISGLLDGDVASVSLQLKQGDSQFEEATNAGTYTIVPVVTIKTKDGSPVADNKYTVSSANGTLTVKKLDITLEAVSDSKPYDGKALINDKVKAPALPAGHKYSGVKLNVYDAKGNLIRNGAKEVGTYTKKITEVHILDAKGTEVTDNYNITKIDGKLTITNSDKNDSKTPKTGDNSMTLYIILIVASVVLLGVLGVFLAIQNRRKRVMQAENDLAEGEYFEPDEAVSDWQEPASVENFEPVIPPDAWAESSELPPEEPQAPDEPEAPVHIPKH